MAGNASTPVRRFLAISKWPRLGYRRGQLFNSPVAGYAAARDRLESAGGIHPKMPMMKNTWTGGQYSLFRGLFGVTLFIQFVRGTPFGLEIPADWNSAVAALSLLVWGALASIALALGFRDRIAALALAIPWIGIVTLDSILANPGLLFFGWLLVAHVLMPSRPFGSWDARDRLDPDGGWHMPNTLFLLGWVFLILGYVYLGLGATQSPDPAGQEFARGWPGFLLLHLFTFNPGWIPSRHPEGLTDVFYDGACGLCHQTIRILLAEDAEGLRFRFAPLDSERFRAACSASGSGFASEEAIPDSVLVQRPQEPMLARSAGVLELGHQLGGFWRLASMLMGWLPRTVLDAGYDFVARVRHRLFNRPEDACPIMPPHLRERFSP